MSTEDLILVQQLVCREREARDRQWWEEMRSAYAEDSFINLSWYRGTGAGFIDESVQLAKRGTTAKHQLGPVIVRVGEGGSRALATVSASIEARLNIQGVEVDLTSQTRLLYRAIKNDREAPWKLCRLDCIYECDHLTPSLPGQSIAISPEDLQPFRSSYKCLSYFLASRGLPTNHELPGDDRPDEVNKVYNEAFCWLAGREPK